MDFAFAPGATKYDEAIRRMFTYRAATTLVSKKGINTVDDFFNNLASQVTSPLTNILIGSHGSESGFMKINLDKTINPDSTTFKTDVSTTFEIMERAIAAIPRVCQLADAVVNPRPLDSNQNPIDASVFIKGCRIGVMSPFIEKFKEVINGVSTTDVVVSAPLFFHAVTPAAQGIFEYFLYDFHIFSNKAIANKDALVDLFDAVKYVDTYGTDITKDQFKNWIPKKINSKNDALIRVNLANTPIKNRPSLKTGRYKFALTNPPVLKLTMNASVGTLPKDQPGIIALLKNLFAQNIADPNASAFFQMFKDTHPFPFFKRFEYDTVDALVDGLEWKLDQKARKYFGRRYEYYVNPPVTANNANNELIYNFYAKPNGGSVSQINFADNDGNYFNVV